MQGPRWYAPPGGNPAQYDAPNGYPAGAPMPEPAGFGVRFAARLLDAIVAAFTGFFGGIIGGVIVGVLASMGAVGHEWQDRIGTIGVTGFLVGSIATLAYHSFAEGIGGASVGKLVCGLRVLREDHRPCTIAKAAGRNLAYYIDALFFGLVAWSAMSKSPTMQRYGDQWAGTVVVKSSSAPASAGSPAIGILLGVGAAVLIRAVHTIVKVL